MLLGDSAQGPIVHPVLRSSLPPAVPVSLPLFVHIGAETSRRGLTRISQKQVDLPQEHLLAFLITIRIS